MSPVRLVQQLALALASVGCRPAQRVYPGELVASEQLAPRCIVRQRIVATQGGKSHRFDAVLQVEGGRLLLLGLTPFGTRAFAIEQRGRSVTFQPYLVRDLPFPARYMVLDIQRAYFQGLGGEMSSPGEHARMVGAELVRETWRDGKLQGRTFERRDRTPPGQIRVRYVGGWAPGGALPSVVLDNEWLSYRLEVTTLQYREL